MKYWLFMFLSFCCAFRMMAVTVDGTLVVNKIKTGDSIYVYNGISKTNRLVDRPRMLMRTEDYDMVNQLLGGIKWTGQRNGHVLKDGIFVEVKASDREVCGLYISSSRFTVMGGGEYSMQSYAVPKKMRGTVDSIISFYRGKLPYDRVIHRFDTCRMKSVVRRNLCMFNPRKKNVCVIFYVFADSSVVPVYYYVYKSKRGVKVWREIPLWDRKENMAMDEEKERNSDTVATSILSNMFYGWNEMSDKERMSALDNMITL